MKLPSYQQCETIAHRHDPDLPVVLGPEHCRLTVRLDQAAYADSLSSVVLRVPEHGGALRTIAGTLCTHSTGVFCSRKNGFLQPYDGLVERALIHWREADASCAYYQSQPFALAWIGPGGWNEWIVDCVAQTTDGSVEATEVKRTPRDLRDEAYAYKLATGFALAHSIGMTPKLRYAADIRGTVHRRRNLALIVRRRSARIAPEALARIDEIAAEGARQPIGRLRRALSNDERIGMAHVHALAARGRIAFDLDLRLCDATSATILPAARPACRIRF